MVPSHRLTPLVILLVSALAAGCGGGDSPTDPQTGTIEIELRPESFAPSQVTITPGSTIRWTNQEEIFHTITPDGHSEWEREELEFEGEVFEHTFETEGVFHYFCEPHQALGMVGTIRVES
jgi:plastocyanin